MFKKKLRAERVQTLTEIDALARSGKPVLVDFFQVGCAPCQVMDGIMNELAREYHGSAHVVKADITRMPDAISRFGIRATPTMVLLAPARTKGSTQARQRATGTKGSRGPITQRWRASGLVPKDQLVRHLESNGAKRVDTA